MGLRWIRLILGKIFLLFGIYALLETGFRQGSFIGIIISLFFLVFAVLLTIFGFKKEKQNIEKAKTMVKKENKLTKIATILLIISVFSTIIALWWGQGEGFAIFLPFFVIVPLFVISLILYIISVIKNK